MAIRLICSLSIVGCGAPHGTFGPIVASLALTLSGFKRHFPDTAAPGWRVRKAGWRPGHVFDHQGDTGKCKGLRQFQRTAPQFPRWFTRGFTCPAFMYASLSTRNRTKGDSEMVVPMDRSTPETRSQGHETQEPRAGLVGRLVRMAVASTARRKRWRDVAQMRSLSDAYLRDIGMSRFGVAWSVPHGTEWAASRRRS
ncbi:MAG: hypothetical protein MI806_32960 [Minwuiales bacterium]|nr:hypothetical protein [Minwuiales bacterium]